MMTDSRQHPSGWVKTQIGDLLEIIRGASPRPKGDPRYFGGNIPWIMISDISREKGKYISTTKDSVTEDGAKKSRYLNAGTLILSNSGTVCVPKILAVDGCIHDGFVAFPDMPSDLARLYFFYWFDFIRPSIIQANRQGVTQVNLNTTIVKSIDIPLPPLPEQHRIVAKVEELFTKLDAGVEALRKLQVQLKRYRQAVLKAAFEGKLTAEWREAHQGELEPASVLLGRIREERRQKAKESGKKYKEAPPVDASDLPQLPQGWEWTSVAAVGAVSGGLTKNAKRNCYPLQMPYLRVANVYANRLELDEVKTIGLKQQEVEKVLLRKGDLLVVEGNGSADQIGRVALWDGSIDSCVHQNHIIKVRLSPTDLGWTIVFWFLSLLGRKHVRQVASSTSGLHTLSISKVGSLLIPFAPLNEQKQIREEIERRFSIADQIEKTIDQALTQSNRLRQSILKRAFEGKLVPQDPNDEPAEQLLERIKAEKAKLETNKPKRTRKRRKPKNAKQIDLGI